ncbi:MAG: hypothetical protein H7833_16040 [Magnetococcus sp. DMHC-1]
MIDMIYDNNILPEGMCAIGRDIYQHTSNSPASLAVRNRRKIASHLLAELMKQKKNADILSVASGHCREVDLMCPDVMSFSSWECLDSDKDSVEYSTSRYASSGMLPMHGSVKSILSSKDNKRYDFIYTLGLYDYLEQRLAQRLTSKMFSMLKPGGKVLIANFVPEIPDVGYMEACMDWYFVYRTDGVMQDLLAEIHVCEIKNVNIFTEDEKNIVFLLAEKV